MYIQPDTDATTDTDLFCIFVFAQRDNILMNIQPDTATANTHRDLFYIFVFAQRDNILM